MKKYSSTDEYIQFFMNIRFPEGFYCDSCECYDYYIIKRHNVKSGYLVQCKNCGKQHLLLANTIFQDNHGTLLQLLLVLYLFL